MSNYDNLSNKDLATNGSTTAHKPITSREQKGCIEVKHSVSSASDTSVAITKDSNKDFISTPAFLPHTKNNESHSRETNVHLPELLTKKQFSPDFLASIGEANLENCNLPSLTKQVACFESIIEHTAFNNQHKIDNYRKMNLESHNHNDYYNRITFSWKEGRLHWSYNQKKGAGMIEFMSTYHNISRREAAIKIAAILGISMENCFNVFPSKVDQSGQENSINFWGNPSIVMPPFLMIRNDIYQYNFLISVNMISGEAEYYLCVYRFQQSIIILIAGRVNSNKNLGYCNQPLQHNNFELGSSPATARLLNRDRIHKNPRAKIIFVIGVLVANQLDKMFIDSKLVSDNDVIVTSYYGGMAIARILDLSDLFGRDIILIPEISREGMLKIIELANKCYKAGASRVSIYPYPVFCFNMTSDDTMNVFNLSDPWERELISCVTELNKVEYPSFLYRKITEQAFELHECIAWGKKMNVFKDEHDEFATKSLSDVSLMNVVNIFPSSEQIDEEMNGSKWCLDEIISAESRTIIWSPTNSGKSLFALHFALALAYKLIMTIFKVMKSRKVALLDAETGSGQWEKRTVPLHGKYRINVDDKDNFWLMHKKGNNAYSDFDLFSPKWQNRLLDTWKQHGTEVLILDNIMSLCPEASRSEAQAKKFFDFISRIESSGIAVIIIHHSNKGKEEMKGVYELEALCQNVISLAGRESFAEEKNLPVEVKNRLNDAGALCKCVVTKCKMAPDLEHLEHYFHLPMDTGRWINLVNEDSSNDAQIDIIDETQVNLSNLSNDTHKLFLHIKELPTNSITRKDVETFLKCGEDKARNLINELKQKKFLDQIGGGPNTAYKLR